MNNRNTELEISTSPAIEPNVCCAPVLSLEEAKKQAIENGKKIKHRFFMPNEYLEYKNGKWITEEGYDVPFHYWIGMVKEMFTDWRVVS